MERICKYCNTKFLDVNGRWFSNHVRWCDKNPNSRNINNVITAIKKTNVDRFGEFKDFSVECFNCGNNFIVNEREKLFPQKEKYFCTRSCANTRTHSEETKDKIKNGILKTNEKRGIQRYICKKICLYCNKEFDGIRKRIYCSKKCSKEDRKTRTDYLLYKEECKFKFNVWDYPAEFDLNLIYKYGWYKPVNRGNNINGISRDHRISIKYGWENNIDAKIISHPANCKLMVHSDNISKNKRCSIFLNELKKEIIKWNEKYINLD